MPIRTVLVRTVLEGLALFRRKQGEDVVLGADPQQHELAANPNPCVRPFHEP
jgi:hypothetical protein